MNEAMQKLVEAVQKASPVVWDAAYRQVWIDGFENAFLAVAFFVAAIQLSKWAKRRCELDEYDHEPGTVFIILGAVVSAILTIPSTLCAIDCFANPTFAAIKQLKGLL